MTAAIQIVTKKPVSHSRKVKVTKINEKWPKNVGENMLILGKP
jgi:hypothetical protein